MGSSTCVDTKPQREADNPEQSVGWSPNGSVAAAQVQSAPARQKSRFCPAIDAGTWAVSGRVPGRLGCFPAFVIVGLGLLVANIFLSPPQIAEGLIAVGFVLAAVGLVRRVFGNRWVRRRRRKTR